MEVDILCCNCRNCGLISRTKLDHLQKKNRIDLACTSVTDMQLRDASGKCHDVLLEVAWDYIIGQFHGLETVCGWIANKK